MCEYCEYGLWPKPIINVIDNEDRICIESKVYVDENLLCSNVCAFGDYVNGSVTINYCPMCGRKLKEQAE